MSIRNIWVPGLLYVAGCGTTNASVGDMPRAGSMPSVGAGGTSSGGGLSSGGDLSSSSGGGPDLIITSGGGDAPASSAPTMIAGCPDCQWATCASGTATTVSGTVHTPAQNNPDPLYNAVVYVPSTAVDAFPSGVSCEQCGKASGNPVAAALSGTDGKFTLSGLPAGHNVPLVVQLGRWRRQVLIPEVKACVDNPVPADLTRFPRNKSEGDIPAMAVVTTYQDVEECVLRKIGIDDSEFTLPTGQGRVHLYQGNGATDGSGTPEGSALWSDLPTLKNYDLVLLPSSSTPDDDGTESDLAADALAHTAVGQYANAGGRVFTTDESDTWLSGDGSPFTGIAQWDDAPNMGIPGFDYRVPLDATIDTSFPKGKALADWLGNLGATTQPGQLLLSQDDDWYFRALAINAPTQRWLYSTTPPSLQSFTFNTPLDVSADKQCGRVFYSLFHVAQEAGIGTSTAPKFPAECNDKPLTPQERVLEFSLFDLASCVQIDTMTPIPPPTIIPK
jgi:hypothetical protein